MIAWGCFEVAKIVRNTCGRVPFRVSRIKSKAYYQTALQVHSGSAQKGKDILKFQKFQKKTLQNWPFFGPPALTQRVL